MSAPSFTVVVPTVGRPSLRQLLDALAQGSGPIPPIVLVDDRRHPTTPLIGDDQPGAVAANLAVLHGPGRGPAAARNVGWRATSTKWVAFLDDDVVPGPDWLARLTDDLDGLDLDGLGEAVGGSQGRLVVPLPTDRRPTDWERNVKGLEDACWATADLAYRRSVLNEVGGFDERFRHAFREDADLGLRIEQAGYLVVQGERVSQHPPRPAGWAASLRVQAGNADDVLMWALHGSGWRLDAAAPSGRLGRHLATTAALALLVTAAWRRRRRAAAVGTLAWAVGTAELAWARIGPGPRTAPEVARMAATSLVLPLVAVGYRGIGLGRLPGLRKRPILQPGDTLSRPPPPRAVLFDRDGTLVVDVAYCADPDSVRLMPGAREAVERLLAHGVLVGVVSNQSGVGRGRMTLDQVGAVNRRVEELVGPIAAWPVCPHGPDEGCSCRKPAPGLVRQAAAALGVEPSECAVVGDIGADVEAARAAGARSVLVPTAATRMAEVEAAPEVTPSLAAAVELLIGASP